jgi:hypothetical protein
MPIVEDNPLVGWYNVFNLGRSLEEGDRDYIGYSWFEAYNDSISPSPIECATDRNYASMQIVFANRRNPFPIELLEVVNPFPGPVRVTSVRELISIGSIRNAHVTVEPVYWPSSMGHSNISLGMSHLDIVDIEESGLSVNDVIPVEGRIGMVDYGHIDHGWRLIIGYRSDNGFLHMGHEQRYGVIDLLYPAPHDPDKRGLVWPVYYESVRPDGIPLLMNLGVHNNVCKYLVDGEELWGRDPAVDPVKLTFPADTISK